MSNTIKERYSFQEALKPGDIVLFRWTNNHSHYAAKAELTKVNKASVRGKLVEAEEFYPVGHEISVPKESFFPINSKWSWNNGVFPVTPEHEEYQPVKQRTFQVLQAAEKLKKEIDKTEWVSARPGPGIYESGYTTERGKRLIEALRNIKMLYAKAALAEFKKIKAKYAKQEAA